jgi:hypothetical protein
MTIEIPPDFEVLIDGYRMVAMGNPEDLGAIILAKSKSGEKLNQYRILTLEEYRIFRAEMDKDTSMVHSAPIKIHPDGRGIWVYKLYEGLSRIMIGALGSAVVDDVW